MFTGIVESIGTVLEIADADAGVVAGRNSNGNFADDLHSGAVREQGAASRRVTIGTTLPIERLPLGASIAVDGVCLTVVDRSTGRFAADLGPETLARTTMGGKRAGDRVHLERPLAMGDALGGHLMAGHVDGVGRIVASRERGAARDLEVAAPPEISGYLVPKGSVAIDGVSLTINSVGVDDRFQVTLIPHTLSVTRLGQLSVGATCNLEADLIAKHVARLVAVYIGAQPAPSLPAKGGATS